MTTFTVKGKPAPKGSRTIGTRKDGSHYTRPDSKYEGPWVEAVATAALQETPLAPPYSVELGFAFVRPKRPANGYPAVDIDKLARASLDGMVRGRLLSDDRHVIELTCSKEWADWEGMRVTVRSV